jgi:hypothetical protein
MLTRYPLGVSNSTGAGLFPKGSLDTRVVFGAAGQASTMPEVMPAQASVSNRWKPFEDA